MSYQRAGLFETSGDIKVAVQNFRATVDLYSRVAALQPDSRKAHDGLAQANYQLGASLCRAGDHANGLPRLRDSMAAAAELTRLVPTSVQYPRLLAIVTRSYANNLADRTAGSYRNLDEALIHIRRAMEIDQAIHEKDASNRSAFADYIRAVGAVGRVHSLRDEWEPSAKFFDQARLMMEGLFKQFPQDTRLADDTAYNTLELAMSLSNLKRYDEAITMLDRSQAIYEGLLAKDSNNRFARFNRALAVRKSGEIDALRGNPAAGRRKIEEVLKVFEDLNRLDPTMKMYSAQIEMTLKSLANLDKQ